MNEIGKKLKKNFLKKDQAEAEKKSQKNTKQKLSNKSKMAANRNSSNWIKYMITIPILFFSSLFFFYKSNGRKMLN